MKRTTKGLSQIYSVHHNFNIYFNYSVVETLRLADGSLFPIPVTLDIGRKDVDRLSVAPGLRISLRDPRDDRSLAIITGLLLTASIWLIER